MPLLKGQNLEKKENLIEWHLLPSKLSAKTVICITGQFNKKGKKQLPFSKLFKLWAQLFEGQLVLTQG